jgi:hypothetical protein
VEDVPLLGDIGSHPVNPLCFRLLMAATHGALTSLTAAWLARKGVPPSCPPACNAVFAENKELMRHTRTALKVNPVVAQGTHGCPIAGCSRTFKTKGWLKSHFRESAS